jgi:F-type H+-transporting ATPase subunit delta
MSQTTVAKRYALALFQIAEEQQAIEQMEEELRVVKQVFVENKDLTAVLKSPKLSLDKKKELLKEAFASLSTYVLNTLMLLIDRHREGEIVAVADAFIHLANEKHGVAEATVYSVRELTEDEKDALSKAFAHKVGKQSLKIKTIIDKELLGGVKLQIGNRIFDGTIRGKLEDIGRQLIG